MTATFAGVVGIIALFVLLLLRIPVAFAMFIVGFIGIWSLNGLNAAYAALRPQGVLAVWSASPDKDFLQRLRKTGFEVDEVRVRARGSKGARYIIWIARRGVQA